MATPVFPYQLWAGTESSLEEARAIYAAIQEHTIKAGLLDTSSTPKAEPSPPYNFSLIGSVGVVTTRGPLLNNDSGYARYYGATTYPDIQRAMVYAALHPSVKAIVHDIGSGGGAVSGAEGTAAQIAMINAKVKPVYSITDDMMASAAYWIGAPASKVYNGKTSIVGSIGIKTTHIEYSKQLENEGVKATTLRAGEFKALADSITPLSAAAEKQIQDQLDAIGGVFADTMAEARGVSRSAFDKTMGEGREFVGQSAVDVGLSDGIMTFDALVSSLNQKILDKEAKTSQNLTQHPKRNHQMSKTALTTQQIAELHAAGPEAVAAALAVAAGEKSAADIAAAAAASAEKSAEALAAAKPAASVTDFLQGQVVSLNAQVGTLTAQVSAAQVSAATASAAVPALLKVVAGSIATMRIALNVAAVDLSAATPEAVLAEYNATAPLFEKSFKAGGVAASGQAAAAVAAKAGGHDGIDPLALAQATRFNPSK